MNVVALVIVFSAIFFVVGYALGYGVKEHTILALKRALGKQMQMAELDRAHREAMSVSYEPIVPFHSEDRFIPAGLRATPNSSERRWLDERSAS